MSPTDVAVIAAIAVIVLWLANNAPALHRAPAADQASIGTLIDQLGCQRDEIVKLKWQIEDLTNRLQAVEAERDHMRTEIESRRWQTQRISDLEVENERLKRSAG